MLKRKEIGKILMLVLLVSFLSLDSASAADDELNDFEDTDGISDLNNSSSYFGEYMADPLFIASRGAFPETIDQEWKNSGTDCWISIHNMGPSYLDPCIKSSMSDKNRLTIVELYPVCQGKINESKIDEIYQTINKHFEHESISEMPVVFMWAQDDEDMPLPDYGPEIFEEAKSDPSFIAAYGTMPVIRQEIEKREWTNLLSTYSRNNKEVLQFFAEFDGPVLSYGTSINGYLRVGLDLENPEKVNASVIDEIYQTINKPFEEEAGINEVPVLFEWEGRAVEDIALDTPPLSDEEDICVIDDDGNVITYTKDEAYFDEDGNLVIIGNETIQEENGTNKQTPGFTSIMLIIGLLLSAMHRK
ncbi:hypothetical protein [Methanococcoides seepicolus]|uniref:Uncharacterized protein n=1 Tax=Methanococcoides seepicolus TaxID=2828780 RepID=A0A9E5DAS1_9EURY|nr:hypothetical protein [Methanococcoides seepicolus]MCM1986336.1 hypothetical protein [Methanococcoides seepicolus]